MERVQVSMANMFSSVKEGYTSECIWQIAEEEYSQRSLCARTLVTDRTLLL